MSTSFARLRAVSGCVLVAAALVGCGRYVPPSDRPEARSVSASDGRLTPTSEGKITRCEDVPPLPPDVGRYWGGEKGQEKTIVLTWVEGTEPETELIEFRVRVDDPTCEERPDIQYWFTLHSEAPRFVDARIVVRPRQDRAYVGYTIIGSGENQYVSPGGVRVVGADGRTIVWKVQTSTGGPADVVAVEGRFVVAPATGPGSGDAYYVDASAVTVGETVTMTFPFQTGPVKVPFAVVAAG